MTGTHESDGISEEHLVGAMRAARAYASLDQEDVAARLGVSRATVSSWERGQTRIPTIARPGLIDGLTELSGLPRSFFTEMEMVK